MTDAINTLIEFEEAKINLELANVTFTQNINQLEKEKQAGIAELQSKIQ